MTGPVVGGRPGVRRGARRWGSVVERLRAHCPVIVVDDASTDGSAAGRGAGRRGGGAAPRAPRGQGRRAPDGVQRRAPPRRDGGRHPGRRRPARSRGSAPPSRRARRGAGRARPGPSVRRRGGRSASRRSGGWRFAPRTEPSGRILPSPVSDSQCGFRIYPGAFLREVALREGGFVLETEALVRAAWAGYPAGVGADPLRVPARPPEPLPRRDGRRAHRVVPDARLVRRRGPADVGRPAAVASGAGLAREL